MRKREVYTVEAPGRDQGKSFLLTEMSARDAEDWGAAMFMLAVNHGVTPEDGSMPGEGQGGMGDLMRLDLSMLRKIPFEAARPLWDQMMRCVRFVPDPKAMEVVPDGIDPYPKSRPINEDPNYPDGDDIEEVGTRLMLRDEVFKLHTGFSIAALASILGRAAMQSNISTTPTSPEPSEASSEESTQP
jgi:hypothetical protein